MRFLLDTDICIYVIKRRPAACLKRFLSYPVDDIAVSVITVAELAYGVSKSRHVERNRLALRRFIEPLRVVAYDETAAVASGEIRASLERMGQPIGSMDLLIAAQALTLGLTLVTHNVREFERIAGLSVETWA
jgi:tRNA(fMet)-specific endonuclease VapC